MNSFFKILKFVLPYRKVLIIATIFSVLYSLSNGITLYSVVPIIDTLTSSGNTFSLTISEEELNLLSGETKGIITAEEHQVTGGLGGAVAEVVAKNYPVPMRFVGMPDCFGESGEPEELMEKYGMKSKNIVVAVKELVDSK